MIFFIHNSTRGDIMKMSITMAVVGGLAIAGVIYFIKNPDKFKMIKNMEIDTMNKMNKMLEENN